MKEMPDLSEDFKALPASITPDRLIMEWKKRRINMATQKEVAKQASTQKIVTVYDFLEQKKDLIAKALPASITPERMIGVFTMVLRSSPELAQCTQSSLIAAVIQTVQLGLTPGNIGHCHFIPFRNKGNLEVQFVIGYKGIVELLNRCGKATLLSTEIVYEGDEFEYELGLNPKLRHIPAWDKEKMPIRGVYCVAKNLVADEKVFVYMDKSEIDKVKSSSKASQSDFSPWNTWYSEMAKKTVVKRICKLLPLSVDDQRKVATDETIKNEIDPDMASVKDNTAWNGDTIEADPKPAEKAPDLNDPEHYPQPPEQDPEPIKPESQESEQVTEKTGDEKPPEQRSSQPPANAITDKQGKRLYAIAKGSGYSDEEIHAHLQWEYQLESTKHIGKDQYEAICAYFEKPNKK